jgi:ribosomal protein L7/L12
MSAQLDRIEAMLKTLAPHENMVSVQWVQQHLVEMLVHMAEGKKIEAIKECCTLTGCGLKESKDLICNVYLQCVAVGDRTVITDYS